MKIAALDFGTNSFLCLIAEISKEGHFRVLKDESVIVRLGQDLQKTGRLHPEALIRAETCLESFSKLIKFYDVQNVQAVATAAAREADNANEFLKICQKYDIPIQTISGQEEALMSFRGAVPPNEQARSLLIDIGGGSTEHIVADKNIIQYSISLSYGAVKLTERFISKQPVLIQEEQALRQFIKTESHDTWKKIKNLNPEKVFAVAGTPTALVAAILGGFDASRIEGYKINQQTLDIWVDNFRASSVEEKKQKYNLGARADIIFAGTIILQEMLKYLEISELQVSTKGIRYGLAYQMLDKHMSAS